MHGELGVALKRIVKRSALSHLSTVARCSSTRSLVSVSEIYDGHPKKRHRKKRIRYHGGNARSVRVLVVRA